MNKTEMNSIILIPSYEPEGKLLNYIKELKQYGLSHIVVVDDGSGKAYQWVFQTLEEEGCIVLRHQVNLGKGAALKTGYNYIKETMPDYGCVATVDSDGQHASKDVDSLAKEAIWNPSALILGERDFKSKGIPVKSLFGNRITSAIFAMLYGIYLPDTQTGLRAFGPPLMDHMIGIKGCRFEYEMQVLITCIRLKIPIRTISIQTIYEQENAGTHFNAVVDSLKIMGVILSNFMRFFYSSIISSVIDISIAWVMLDFLRIFFAGEDFLRIICATAVARSISISVNYQLNKRLVFNDRQTGIHGVFRYLSLSVLIMLLSAVSVYLLHKRLLINEKAAKIICDMSLFFLSYHIQRRWVFQSKEI